MKDSPSSMSSPPELSPEVLATITELFPSNDPLDNPDFNPVEYVNALFPNEQSLVDIDKVIGKLKVKISRLDGSATSQVRSLSQAGKKGNDELMVAKTSITELFEKITEIKAKAEQSEQMVQEICRDIKSLDYAKDHLTLTIRSLKKMNMLVRAVDQLPVMEQNGQYQEVANLLEAQNQLTEYFKDYSEIPKIMDLKNKTKVITDRLNRTVIEKFRMLDNEDDASLPSSPGPAISSADLALPAPSSRALSDICFVVDALGDSTRETFMQWFCDRELIDYRKKFRYQDGMTCLETLTKRYLWLRKELKRFDGRYRDVFPKVWRVDEFVTFKFCELVRGTLQKVLEQNGESLKVEQLLAALQDTVTFEKKICTRFVSQPAAQLIYEGVQIGARDDKRGNGSVADDMLDTTSHASAASQAIRMKYAKAKLEEENKKKQEDLALDQQEAEAKKNEALKFKGIISKVFEPYLNLYIQQEDKSLSQMLEKVLREETWTVGENDAHKILSSSRDMVLFFLRSLTRCAAVTRNQSFFNMYKLFKKYLLRYADALKRKLPTYTAAEGRLNLTFEEEKVLCLIINTAEYCSTTTAQMEEKFKSNIDEAFVQNINMSSEQDTFSRIVAAAIKLLVVGVETKVDPALLDMTKLSWATWSMVGDQSAYVTEITKTLTSSFPMYSKFLSTIHLRFFCDNFLNKFIGKLLQSVYKCKRVSNIGAEQLLLDITSLKSLLISLPTLGTSETAPPSRWVKLVKKKVVRIENLLKVTMNPVSALVPSFITLLPDCTEANFIKILDLKGVKKGDQLLLLETYRELKKKKKQDQPKPSSAKRSS